MLRGDMDLNLEKLKSNKLLIPAILIGLTLGIVGLLVSRKSPSTDDELDDGQSSTGDGGLMDTINQALEALETQTNDALKLIQEDITATKQGQEDAMTALLEQVNSTIEGTLEDITSQIEDVYGYTEDAIASLASQMAAGTGAATEYYDPGMYEDFGGGGGGGGFYEDIPLTEEFLNAINQPTEQTSTGNLGIIGDVFNAIGDVFDWVSGIPETASDWNEKGPYQVVARNETEAILKDNKGRISKDGGLTWITPYSPFASTQGLPLNRNAKIGSNSLFGEFNVDTKTSFKNQFVPIKNSKVITTKRKPTIKIAKPKPKTIIRKPTKPKTVIKPTSKSPVKINKQRPVKKVIKPQIRKTNKPTFRK